MAKRRPPDDPPPDTLHARRTVHARDLLVWSASAGKVEHALLPSNGQPNPIVVGDLVIASVFSPGRIVAFDRESGKRRWVRALKHLGRSHVYDAPGPGLVYGGTSQELLALDPATGKVRWTFCPYGRKSETIYSSPTVAEGRLFIGDRQGYFHCLNAATGEPVWRVHTSRAKNNDVNSDPVVEGGVVAVPTNAGWALGYDGPTGRELWRHRLDGPCVYCRSGGGRTALMWTRRSAYLFSVPDGQLLRRWQVRGRAVHHACAASDLVLLVTNQVQGHDREPAPTSELRAFRGGEQVYTQASTANPVLRYEPTTGEVYETTFQGLGILDPQSGTRELVIQFSTGKWTPEEEYTHPPFVEAGVLYATNMKGRVFALRHHDRTDQSPRSPMPARPYILAESTWQAVRDTRFEVAVLPWGATEAHNYHLPYATDNIQCDWIAAEAARRAWDAGARVIVLPTIPYGVQTGQIDIPLCLNMNPSTQAAVLADLAHSLDVQGIRKLVILNGHGGNDFRQMIRELQPKVKCFLTAVHWYKVVDPKGHFTDLGDHAGELETSVMLHIAPQLVQLAAAGDGHERKPKIAAMREGWAWAPRRWTQVSADTGIGDPRAATREKGAAYFDAAAGKLGQFLIDLAAASPNDLYAD